MLSKSLNQFSVDGQGCVPSLLFDLRPNYGGGNAANSQFPGGSDCNADNIDLPQKVQCRPSALRAPNTAAVHC